ncbi:MAG TPA: hypothetical protein VK543_14960 [Puia sp.]|nr:hypothetical protein [Puia sp.]
MKQLCLLGALCGIFILTSTNSWAQRNPEKKDSIAQKKSHWIVGTSYQSNDVYLGRKDSVSVPYFTPSIGYHDKSGLFLTGSFSYLPKAGESRIDVVTIEGGYSYTSDDLSAELSLAKDFYNDQSYAVSAEIKGRISARVSYDLGFIEPSVDLGAIFADKPDVVMGFGLEHSFSFFKEKLEIDPTFRVNAGSQNYYSNYYSKRRYSSKRNTAKGNNTASITASLANASRFAVMDYEWELSVEYKLNKRIKLSFTPTLAIPVNPSTVTIVTKSPGNSITSQIYTESLSSTYYFALGFSYAL